MATVTLGNIKLNWKGAYNAGTAYAIDDVVSYNGSSYVAKTATTGNLPTVTANWDLMSQAGTNGTNGTDLTSTLTTQGDLVYRDASGLQRLGAGTSGYFLKTQGSGANPVWSEVTAKFVKAQKFHETTRYSIGSGSSDINLWNWGNFSKSSATSKLYYHGYCPGRRTENDHSFVKFTATDSASANETDNHNLVHGAHSSVSTNMLNLHGKFDTAFATGNVGLQMVLSSDNIANRGHGGGMIWNTNNSDDNRLPSTSSGSYLMVYEIED